MSPNLGFTTDGQYFYIHYKKFGLYKIGTGENGDQMIGKVYAHKNYRINEKCKLLYFNGRLLCRSQTATTKALYVLDPVTLDETKELIINDKTNPFNLEWKDDKENNRFMGITPLFTDSQHIYTLSYKKPEKGKKHSYSLIF